MKTNPVSGFFRKLFSAPRRRAFDAGRVTRTTADWNPGTTTADVEIANSIVTLRARARDHERNNDYARRYYSAVTNNVLKDEVGFSLQMQVRDTNGKPDTYASTRIETAWREWSKPSNCTSTGMDGLYDVLALTLRAAMRDGGALVELIQDSSVNKFGFALRPVEIDHLDVTYFDALQNGNTVFLGVEKTPGGKVVAYWLTDRHPGESILAWRGMNVRRRIPTQNLIHYFIRERATQHVGVPWLCSAMTRLNHLKEYERAELIAARSAAEKGGWFKTKDGSNYTGDGTDSAGNTITDSAPGSFEQLPSSVDDFIPYDPKHPTDAFSEFVRATLRGVAAGGNISYFTLTGDPDASVAAQRNAKIEENEGYRKIQSHLIRHFMLPVFEKWLESAFLSGIFDPLPFSKFDKFNAPKFSGRRWGWFDPEKEIRAALLAIDGGLATRTQYTEENSGDFEEMLDTLAAEKELADKKKLVFITPTLGGSKPELLNQVAGLETGKEPPKK